MIDNEHIKEHEALKKEIERLNNKVSYLMTKINTPVKSQDMIFGPIEKEEPKIPEKVIDEIRKELENNSSYIQFRAKMEELEKQRGIRNAE